MREGDWKLRADKQKRELFHLGRDESETRDVSGENPDVVKRLLEQYGQLEKSLPRFSGETTKIELDEEQLERLRALGYVE